MKKILFFFGLVILLSGAVLFGQPVVKNVHADPPTSIKVTICHWDEGQGGKYTSNDVSINSISKCNNVNGHGDHDNDIIPPFVYTTCSYGGKNLDKVSWIANDCKAPVDMCPNIADVQTSVPYGYVKNNDGLCVPAVVDMCSNIAGTQNPIPTNMQTNEDHVCSCAAGYHQVAQEVGFTCEQDSGVTPTVTVTPTPTNTPSNGGGSNDGGDGLGCATHDCSGNQVGGGSSSSQPIQAVLGASTMAGTGTFENTVMNFMLAAGIVVLALGAKKYAKESK